MAAGKANGHHPDYYDVGDQRFLGDKRFVEGRNVIAQSM
jgi:hypothetical protein